MSKPAFWIVYAPGREPQKFTRRSVARAYRAALKIAGIESIIKAIGG